MPATKNFIHATALIDPSVQLGHGNYFGPYCVVAANVRIGNNNRFEGFCTVGTPPEHEHYWKSKYETVQIGDDCTIREFVTINAGTIQDTVVGSQVLVLRGSYVGHDCTIEDHVTVSCNTMLGGHSYVFRGANLGLNVAVHQFSVIGHYTMLGMSTVVTKKSQIVPGNTFVGVPARKLKVNQVGLDRNKVDSSKLAVLMQEYQERLNRIQKLRAEIQIPAKK